MTRKDYALLAAVIKASYIPNDRNHNAAVQTVARVLAAAIGDDNPAFDIPRFLRDCGVTV